METREMRVTAGSAKGKKLIPPKSGKTRPTTDKVKEAIFSALGSPLPGIEVADLFAGTGALGIEALSRGASFCHFVESDIQAAKSITANLDATGFTSRSKVWKATVSSWIKSQTGEFRLVLADPPYGIGLPQLGYFCDNIAKLIGKDGVLVLEYSSRSGLPKVSSMALQKSKVYGDTVVGFYQKEGGGDEQEDSSVPGDI